MKRFDRVAVVDGASLEVRPGELTVLLGPSGSGKTMLARLVAGLETPDEGEIFFDGRLIHTLAPIDRRVGMVFQEDSLWPRMTVAENVSHALRLRGIKRIARRQRVAEALSLLRIESLADRRPDQLSSAQRLKVELARAIVLDPEFLIVDEPLGRIDIRERTDMRDDLRRVHAELETTMLMLTDDPREALSLADRVAVMDLGRIVQAGSPAEVYNRPTDAFVAQFLGPTNLFHGLIEGADPRGEVVVRTPLGRLVGVSSGASLTNGAPVTVSIRPEALGFGTSIPANSNRFPATIERQIFRGETRQVLLRGPGDWPLSVVALQSQSLGLREGQNLTIFVPPEHVVVLQGRYAAAN